MKTLELDRTVDNDFPDANSYHSRQMLCVYVNATNQVQIARIANIAEWYFERVVFPGQRLLFEAPPEAQLEIYTSRMATAILSEKIRCDRLQVTTNDAG
jgi:hypothetical protein